MGVQEKQGFIVFSDLKGFSKLDPEEQENYLNAHVYFLSKSIKPLLENKACVSNTWGDAIIAVFEDGMEAAEFMLSYRGVAKTIMPIVSEKKRVLPRIAGHYGKVNVFMDPLIDQSNTISNEVNTAARIEPITRPGEIFVSEEFKKAFELQFDKHPKVKFERLGPIPLAKGHGEKVLHRLIKSDEKAHIIDKLFDLKLPKALPKTPDLDVEEEKIIVELRKMTNRNEILGILEKEKKKKHTGKFAYETAKICKRAGLYQVGVDWIESAQQECVETSGIALYPYKTKKDFIKLKADLLTRLGSYKESAEILFSLWTNIEGQNTNDASEILAMLAAQFKRRALIEKEQVLFSSHEVDKELLEKAAGLYLEAFRYDIDNYYPAINAAYLLVMLGGNNKLPGRKLARYIKDTWVTEKGMSHWLDVTLAETEILQGDYEEAAEDLRHALELHSKTIGVFDIESTKEQIKQFLKIMDAEEEGQELIKILDEHLKLKQFNYEMEGEQI